MLAVAPVLRRSIKVNLSSYSATQLSLQATGQREHRVMCILAVVIGSIDCVSDKFCVSSKQGPPIVSRLLMRPRLIVIDQTW